MDICGSHNDYIKFVRSNNLCDRQCCDKKTGEYCPSFQQGLPEIMCMISPDDIVIVNKAIKAGESKYKNIKEYTKDYVISAEQIRLVLKKKIRRDTRFMRKINRLQDIVRSGKYSVMDELSAKRTIEKVYF